MSAKEYRRRALRAAEEAERSDDRGRREVLWRRARLCMKLQPISSSVHSRTKVRRGAGAAGRPNYSGFRPI